jgi:phospholipid-transporting ATPase
MMLSEEAPEVAANRIIYINDTVKNAQVKYLHNGIGCLNLGITTGKYNLFTFVPKFLFEQFSKYANLFFLFIAIIQVGFK